MVNSGYLIGNYSVLKKKSTEVTAARLNTRGVH